MILLFSDSELARKQLEVELASSNLWLKFRWGIADWLPWIVGAALLFVIWKWVLKKCPQCQRRFPKQIAGHTVRLPTSTQPGLAIITYRCRGCRHEWKFERILTKFRIPRGKSGPSSGTGSSSRPSSSFRGFGGGSSGGGGSTRGY
jgi:uncharacterized membrane protein YgcG